MSKKNEKNASTAPVSSTGDDVTENEGGTEGDTGTGASFMVSDGKEMLRVIATKDNWCIQKRMENINKETGVSNPSWSTFKYVTDIGSVANRIFELRLKNSEATTLLELSAAAKQIAIDVRNEFSISGGCGCK